MPNIQPFCYHPQERIKKKRKTVSKLILNVSNCGYACIWKCLRVLWSFCVQKTIHMVNQILYIHIYMLDFKLNVYFVRVPLM